jgi:hypothetical protein
MTEKVGGPYLSMAYFCEKVLREADGVISTIRIVDRFTVQGTADEMPATIIAFTIVIVFKSGDFRGRSEIELRPESPSGKQLPAIKFPVNFEGEGDRGTGIGIMMQFKAEEEGLFWFDVLLQIPGGAIHFVTRIPMRVIYQRVVAAGGA